MAAKNPTETTVSETKNEGLAQCSGGTEIKQQKNIPKRKSWFNFFFKTRKGSEADKIAKSTVTVKTQQTVATTIQPRVTGTAQPKIEVKAEPTIHKETKPLPETSNLSNMFSKIKNLPKASEVDATKVAINTESTVKNETNPLTSNLAAMFSKSKYQKNSGYKEPPAEIKKSKCRTNTVESSKRNNTPAVVAGKTKYRSGGGGLKLFLVRMALSAGAVYSTCYLNVWGSADDSQELVKKIKSIIFKT